MKVILASGSPRRRSLITQLAEQLHFDYEILPNDFDEGPLKEQIHDPTELVKELSLAKAQATYDQLPDPTNTIVIGADLVVSIGDQILGKPNDPVDAHRMLRTLSGTNHQVISGLACIINLEGVVTVETTVTPIDVYFRELNDDEITEYIATGEPLDKAGAYAIQGGAKKFIDRYEGDYTAVVGLDLTKLTDILTKYL